MISRKLFVDTLVGIKKEFEKRDSAEKELAKFGLRIDADRTPFLESMLEILKEIVPDPYDYISWWLYDASDYCVSWEEDGQKIEKDLQDPNNLYDFLLDGAAKATDVEALVVDVPAKEYDLAPQKMIEQTDFLRYMDAVLNYLETHDIVIQIAQEGVGKYVVMGAKLYHQLFEGYRHLELGNEDNMVTVEIEIDADLECRARQALKGTGFSLEQVCEMFIVWCAHYPKDAAEWIKRAKKRLEDEEKASAKDEQTPG